MSGSGNNYRLQFDMDAFKASSNAHAYDFITTWEAALAFNNALSPAKPLYVAGLLSDANRVCGQIAASMLADCLALRAGLNVAVADHSAIADILGGNVQSRLNDYQARYNPGGDSSALKVHTDQPINSLQAGATTTITFNAAAPGTYIIGIKYQANSVTDFPAPGPNTTVAYQLTMPGVPGSASGILLQPKP